MSVGETTVSLSEIDTIHLAKQALKLFSRRYGRAFDTYAGTMGMSGKDCSLSYDDFLRLYEKGYSGITQDKVEEKAKRHWYVGTGGHPEIKLINRQEFIDLTVKGFHSKDSGHIEKLMAEVMDIAGFLFHQVDENEDGQISKEEYYALTNRFDANDEIDGVFEAMDLNGDGQISREEFLKCYEGFYLYVDEERYNHILGVLDE